LSQHERHLERKGVPFARYLDACEPKKRGFPIYLILIPEEKEEVFVYSAEELAKLTESIEKKKGKAVDLRTKTGSEEGNGREETVEVVEIFESREIEKAGKQLERFGISLSDYKSNREATYELSCEKKQYSLNSLAAVLEQVKQITKEGMAIQRYKGLGEMNPGQLWETTMDPGRRTIRRVNLEDVVEADEIFTMLMGEQVEPRRQFIERYAKAVRNLDV